MKGIDIAVDPVGNANDLAAHGVQAVGLYMRGDRASLRGVKDLHDHRIKIWSIYERGEPATVSYFTPERAEHDANEALMMAKTLGMPFGKEIFFTVDFDPKPDEVKGPILQYAKAVQQIVKKAGYLSSVYGSGLTCGILTTMGYAHSGYLAGSTGWDRYTAFKPLASILQTKMEAQLLHFDVDWDEIVDESVLW